MESISFFINSKKRESGSTDDSDFYYNFNYRGNENVDNVLNIDSLCIPRSYYSVNDYNNTFQLGNTDLVGILTAVVSDVVLTNGDYTPTTLINEVTSKINELPIGISGENL